MGLIGIISILMLRFLRSFFVEHTRRSGTQVAHPRECVSTASPGKRLLAVVPKVVEVPLPRLPYYGIDPLLS
jgi:hypothetical protein